jgi:hypothetical protein
LWIGGRVVNYEWSERILRVGIVRVMLVGGVLKGWMNLTWGVLYGVVERIE